MQTHSRVDTPLAISTPFEPDTLLLEKFSGRERVSQPFHFHLDLIAEIRAEVKFEKILGRAVTVRMNLSDGSQRFFNGIVSRFGQGGRNARGFGSFRAEVVPAFWLLKHKVRSRIFQRTPVPEILRQVLTGFDVLYRLTGQYPRRDFVVQYREPDFDFASRLMEEEGIWYYFEHTDGNHRMVVTDRFRPVVPGHSTPLYDTVDGAKLATDMRIMHWEKTQNLRPVDFTFWDHTFELPGKNLEAKSAIAETLKVGTVVHQLRVPPAEKLEVYDFPGGYAQRFDGVDAAGTPQEEGIRNVFADRDRSALLRAQQEESVCFDLKGESYCGNFSAGHSFTMRRHFDADGEYMLTQVDHKAEVAGYQTGERPSFSYGNKFECVPLGMNFRPQRITKKPTIAGVQTATVVGPAGEQIFVDKYGRVKVQFHWDREGLKDMNSSCWVRVSQFWAGNRWGAFFWPRIGHEVVVVFEEGDPDQPLVIGSVYNAENMPFFELPQLKDRAGVKSDSLDGNPHAHFNGIVMIDTKGGEHLVVHSERHLIFDAELDKQFRGGRHHDERIPLSRIVTVGLPGGGGSGGGDDDDEPQRNAFDTAIDFLASDGVSEDDVSMGLSASVTYGLDFGSLTGVSVGSLLGGEFAFSLAPINASLGMAYSSAVNLGGEWGFHVGSSRFSGAEYSVPQAKVSTVMLASGIFAAIASAYSIAFAVVQDNRTRRVLTNIYSVLLPISVMAINALAATYRTAAQALADQEHKSNFSGTLRDVLTNREAKYSDGTLEFGANEIILTAMLPGPPAVAPVPSKISLLADSVGTEGRVDVKASQGVRITAGPGVTPPASNPNVNGVEIVTGDAQLVTIQRGCAPANVQKIEMSPTTGINIDAGTGAIQISSATSIILSVAGGESKIELTTAGIVIKGPLVNIN